jgi:hypothetical protein
MSPATRRFGGTERATQQANPNDKQDREARLGEKPKRGQRKRGQGGDPRSLPGSQDLGDQREPQTKGGMVKGT